MVLYKVYLGKKRDRFQINDKVSYSFDGKTICVYENDKIVCLKAARPNDALVLIIEDNQIKIEKQKLPKENGACIAWLLGFNQHQRFKSFESYENCCNSKRQKFSEFNYKETNYESEKYKLTYFSYVDSKKPMGIAAMVKDDLTKEEILKLIPLMVFQPEWFVRRILRKRFDISEEEFFNAKKE